MNDNSCWIPQSGHAAGIHILHYPGTHLEIWVHQQKRVLIVHVLMYTDPTLHCSLGDRQARSLEALHDSSRAHAKRSHHLGIVDLSDPYLAGRRCMTRQLHYCVEAFDSGFDSHLRVGTCFRMLGRILELGTHASNYLVAEQGMRGPDRLTSFRA